MVITNENAENIVGKVENAGYQHIITLNKSGKLSQIRPSYSNCNHPRNFKAIACIGQNSSMKINKGQ